MKGIARTCSCGARIEPGGTCSRCSTGTYSPGRCVKCGSALEVGMICGKCLGRVDERSRGPQRRRYTTAAHRKNRLERYRIAGGRCETCGVPLAGELFDTSVGVKWEADHVIALVDGGTDDVANYRVRCLSCHHRKTAAESKARRARNRR